jgi:hypothetical protein
MLVVRKLDQELAWRSRIAEGEPRIIPGRHLRMANGTDGGLCPFEKLRTMTTDACIVTWVVCDIGEVAYFFPVVSRNLVAGIAGLLVFFGTVEESGIVD